MIGEAANFRDSEGATNNQLAKWTRDQLVQLAGSIRRIVTVRDLATAHGLDYSVSGNHPCPACRHVSSSKLTLALYDGASRWHCFHCNTGGDVIDYEAHATGISKGRAIASIAARLRLTPAADSLAFAVARLREISKADQGDSLDVDAAAEEWYRRAVREFADGQSFRVSDVLLQYPEVIPAAAWQIAVAKIASGSTLVGHDTSSLIKFADGSWSKSYLENQVLRSGSSGCHNAAAFSYWNSRRLHDHPGAIESLCRETNLLYRNPLLPLVGLAVPKCIHTSRLVLPIFSAAGYIVAAWSRKLDSAPGPKWIGPKNTGVYNKSCVFASREDALGLVSIGRVPMLVEGIGDALTLEVFEHGRFMRYPAATRYVPMAMLGARLHRRQARLLRKCKAWAAVVVTDGDSTGDEGSRQTADMLRSNLILPVVVRLPRGKDPDEMPEAVLAAADRAMARLAAQPSQTNWAAEAAAKLRE